MLMYSAKTSVFSSAMCDHPRAEGLTDLSLNQLGRILKLSLSQKGGICDAQGDFI
jgi:hypothetical protein